MLGRLKNHTRHVCPGDGHQRHRFADRLGSVDHLTENPRLAFIHHLLGRRQVPSVPRGVRIHGERDHVGFCRIVIIQHPSQVPQVIGVVDGDEDVAGPNRQ